jgi:hypothetical protein
MWKLLKESIFQDFVLRNLQDLRENNKRALQRNKCMFEYLNQRLEMFLQRHGCRLENVDFINAISKSKITYRHN